MGIIRDSFIIFKNWVDAINNLPEDYQLECYKALVEYGTTGDIPEHVSAVTRAMLISFSVGMENSFLRYKSSVENGKLGGRPKKETQQNLDKPKVTQANPNEPNHNLNVNDNVNVNNINLVVDDIQSTTHTCVCETTTSTLQDLEDLKSLCKGINIDCTVDFYKYNFHLLVEKVKESRYLKMFRSLSELLNKYDYIIADKYKDFNIDKLLTSKGKEARKRTYTKEQYDSLFDNIQEVEI